MVKFNTVAAESRCADTVSDMGGFGFGGACGVELPAVFCMSFTKNREGTKKPESPGGEEVECGNRFRSRGVPIYRPETPDAA